jgi:hypothetical protein
MIEIENFLSKETCNHCINFFNTNESKSLIFHKRKKLPILEMLNVDLKIDQLVDKYKKIYPGFKISNFEILKWPVGELHDWHNDTIYYNKTTITYLNEDYEGGRTTVDQYTVKPKIGKIILFNSELMHMVSPLVKGERYVILVWYNKNG